MEIEEGKVYTKQYESLRKRFEDDMNTIEDIDQSKQTTIDDAEFDGFERFRVDYEEDGEGVIEEGC